jgi:hypothetical protein
MNPEIFALDPASNEFLLISPDYSETLVETHCENALEACLSVKSRTPWNFLPYWGGWLVYAKLGNQLDYQGTVNEILGDR